jgi:hypothetical protein
MTYLRASFSENSSMGKMKGIKGKKGQMKIQQMAFVLLAVFVFFVIVALFYLSFQTRSITQTASELEAENVKQNVLKLVSSPEFAWKTGNSKIEDCLNCLDLDKAFAIKNMPEYANFWELTYLSIQKLGENNETECSSDNYPDCGKITLVQKGEVGTPQSAFVAICRRAFENGNFFKKCELGKIYASGKAIG